MVGVGRPMEIPLSVERMNLGTLRLTRRQLKGGVVGQLVDTYDMGILPVVGIRLGLRPYGHGTGYDGQ